MISKSIGKLVYGSLNKLMDIASFIFGIQYISPKKNRFLTSWIELYKEIKSGKKLKKCSKFFDFFRIDSERFKM